MLILCEKAKKIISPISLLRVYLTGKIHYGLITYREQIYIFSKGVLVAICVIICY